MKLPAISLITKEDLAKIDKVPNWVDALLDPLNVFIQNMVQALQQKLDFLNNFYGTEVSFKIVHGVAQTYSPAQRIKGIQLIDPGGQIVTGFGWSRLSSNNSVSITVNFQAGGGASATCLFQVQFG